MIEPTRPGAGGTELEGPPEGSTNPPSRSSLRASLGSPDSPQGSLLFRFPHFPPHLHLFWIKVGQSPTNTGTTSSWWEQHSGLSRSNQLTSSNHPNVGSSPEGPENSLLVRVAQRDPQAPAAPPHWQMAEKQMAHCTAQEGTQEPSGRYFLASVSPATLGKAPCHWSRPGVRAPPLLGGLCPGQPSSSSPSLPPGSHGPRGRRASPGSRWQNPGPTRPRPRPGPGLSQPSPRREPRSA